MDLILRRKISKKDGEAVIIAEQTIVSFADDKFNLEQAAKLTKEAVTNRVLAPIVFL